MKGTLTAFKAISLYNTRVLFREQGLLSIMVGLPYLLALFYYFFGKGLGGEQALENFKIITGSPDAFFYMLLGSSVLIVTLIGIDSVAQELYYEIISGTLEVLLLTKIKVPLYLMALSIPYFIMYVLIVVVTVMPLAVWLHGLHGLLTLIISIVILFIGLLPLHGVSMITGGLVIKYKEPGTLLQPIRALLLVFSGVLYPVKILPYWTRFIASVLPPYYLSEGLRAIIIFENYPSLPFFIVALLGLSLLYQPLGFLAYRRIEKLMKRTGELARV